VDEYLLYNENNEFTNFFMFMMLMLVYPNKIEMFYKKTKNETTIYKRYSELTKILIE